MSNQTKVVSLFRPPYILFGVYVT